MQKHTQHKINSEYVRIFTLRAVGNFLVLSSLFMLIRTFYAPVQEEVKYFVDQQIHKKYIVASAQTAEQPVQQTQTGGLAKLLNLSQVEVLTPEDPNFSIVIPKIGANSRVIPNVDPANEDVYLAALKKGVAQAAGTGLPGEGKHIFLFAHSTNYFYNVSTYNAVFYLLYKLEKNDEVDLFYQGQKYVYRVVDRKVIDPSQVEYLTRQSNKELLTLQTCWPPGTTLKRLLVFATRVAE